MVKILSYCGIYTGNERSDKCNSEMINHDVSEFTSVLDYQQKEEG
jgi:hypothetical protein